MYIEHMYTHQIVFLGITRQAYFVQVNKKFHKFERVYRDCIKRTRDKTRIHCIPHDAPGT